MSVYAPLRTVPALADELYAKLEYLHPSGSLKHRAIPPVLTARKASGEIGSGQRIAVLSAGAAAVTVAWTAAQLGHRALAVMPSDAPANLVRQLRWLGAEVLQIEARELEDTLARLHADPETYVFSQLRAPELVEHYRVVAREIVSELPHVRAIVVGIGTGASISGIGRETRSSSPECLVVGVEPEESAVASGRPWAPHSIHGLAPPMPQTLLDRSVIDEIVPVPAREAWNTARLVARANGLLVGPSAGATLAVANRLRGRGLAGPIVAVCSCSIADYLDGVLEVS